MRGGGGSGGVWVKRKRLMYRRDVVKYIPNHKVWYCSRVRGY